MTAQYDDNSKAREAIPTYWDNGDATNLDRIAKGVGTLVVITAILTLVSIASLVLGIIAYSNWDDHIRSIDQSTNAVEQAPIPAPVP